MYSLIKTKHAKFLRITLLIYYLSVYVGLTLFYRHEQCIASINFKISKQNITKLIV